MADTALDYSPPKGMGLGWACVVTALLVVGWAVIFGLGAGIWWVARLLLAK
jgi:hypothetical protein